MEFPPQFASSSAEFRSSVGIEAPNRGVSGKGEECLLSVLGRVAELRKALQPPRAAVVDYDRVPLAVPAKIVSRNRQIIGGDLVAETLWGRTERIWYSTRAMRSGHGLRP